MALIQGFFPRRLFVASVFWGAATAGWAQNTKRADLDLLQALVAKATRLSVLSDRITRSQVQRTMGVLSNRADKVLADSVAEAKRLLADVANSVPTAVRPQHQAMAQGYERFLATSAALNPQDKTAVLRFAHQADEVGEATDRLVDQLIREMGQPVARILSTTADLQRLTQHLAVHYLLVRTGADDANQQKEVNEGREAFNRLLGELRKSDVKSGQIGGLLPLLDGQWTLMNQALNFGSRDANAMENVCTTSERTLEVLTSLYPHYEAVLRQASASN